MTSATVLYDFVFMVCCPFLGCHALSGASRLELKKRRMLISNNIARRTTESTVRAEKTCGFFRAGVGKRGRQKETLMSPEIAVGGGISFIPMEFSQS